MNELRKDSMLVLPSEAIKDVDSLLSLLKLPNPAYANRAYMSFGANKIPEFNTYYSIDKVNRTITVPRNIPTDYYDKKKVQNQSSYGKMVMYTLNQSFRLRDYQETYFNKEVLPRVRSGEEDMNFSVPCGHGKTMMALFLASLRMTNVVVGVTTHKLAKQWIDAATFMFPDNTVSLYEPNKKKYQLTDIVISTYNTLGSEKCGKDFFAQFGHAIFDEVHRAAAKEFLPALESAVCKYRTSLSATFRRKDGLHEVLRHHCGQAMVMKRQTPGAAVIPLRTGITVDMEAMRVVDKRQTPVGDLSYLSDVVVREAEMEEKAGKVVDITYAPLTEQELLSKEKIKPKVTKVVVQFGATQKTYTGPVFPKFYAKGTLSSARIKSEVADDKDRQQLLLELLNECFQKGRNTLVLSARKDMLYALSDALTAAPYFIPNGIVVSQKSTKQREYCQRLGMTTDEQERYCVNESSVILGIDKLAEEGFDVERLDTLIIAHPIRDIEQAVGRILRIHKGKKPPMVFYLIDDIKTSKAAWMEARKQFMELENRVLPEVDFNAFKERYVKS
jgi:superfamily II DNA or RNA helicase